MSIVLDTSAALAWVYADETTEAMRSVFTLVSADLALLPISVDGETDRHAWGATLQLSERHRLTLYDAAYLELSLRRGLPLASLDAELRGAAQAEGVVVLGSYGQTSRP